MAAQNVNKERMKQLKETMPAAHLVQLYTIAGGAYKAVTAGEYMSTAAVHGWLQAHFTLGSVDNLHQQAQDMALLLASY
jgi:hypothetical protein